ncbi:MAG: NAD(P)-dependent oxidoreductase [Gammaproteobacteria bacterium]|nr:NAD(P)-dependent oxidoreductase [Gammaproteobacteria bacterium]
MAHKVLVTGLSGLIGSLLGPELERVCEVTALNRSAVDGIPTTQADIADEAAIRPAFDGIDTVIHLAAKAGGRHPWSDLLTTNIVGTYNVLKLARKSNCRRFIFASSGATVTGYETIQPYLSIVKGQYSNVPEDFVRIDHTQPPWSSGTYGSTKIWGEAICRNFADSSDMNVFCVRIGYVNRENKPLKDRDWATWCSQRDVVNALMACVTKTDPVKFTTFFVTSNNKWGYRDLTHAYDAVGFSPIDSAESYRESN